AIYSGALCPTTGTTPLACNDDACGTSGLRSRLVVSASASQYLKIRVGSYDPSTTGTGTIVISCQSAQPPANDNCGSATSIGNGTSIGTSTGATGGGDDTCGSSSNSPDVWYTYEPITAGTLYVNTCSSSCDTVVSIHNGCPGTLANEVACSDDFCGLQSA